MKAMKVQMPADFYKSLFDKMLDGLAHCQMIYDEQGNPTDFVFRNVNENFGKLTGLKDVINKKITELVPGIYTSNPEFFEIYGRVALGGKPERFEAYVEPLSRWFLISVYSPKKGDFIAIFQNITPQKLTESKLKNANIATRNALKDLETEKSKVVMAKAKEEALLESIGDGMIATDKEGNLISMSHAAEKMLGCKKRQALGKKFYEVFGIKDEKGNIIPLEQRPISVTLATGKKISTSTTTTIYYEHKDGGQFPVALTSTPVIFNSRVIGVIEIFRDVTKEKEVDKSKTEFASLVSHQLLTPFSTVNWYVELLLSGDVGKLQPKQKAYMKEVSRASRRMLDLINVLLSISRIEMGVSTADKEQVEVTELAKVIVKERLPEIRKRGLTIHKTYEKDIPGIHAEPKLLSLIFQNLLSNAVKYTPAGGKISLSIMRKKNDIHISVSDTGIGIPKKEQPRIFDRFYRATNAKMQEPDGNGLGLYILKTIIDKMDGKVWFKSQEGKGTTFYVTIPLKLTPATRNTSRFASTKSLRN
jgi:PAS domain S-box-containing protein